MPGTFSEMPVMLPSAYRFLGFLLHAQNLLPRLTPATGDALGSLRIPFLSDLPHGKHGDGEV